MAKRLDKKETVTVECSSQPGNSRSYGCANKGNALIAFVQQTH
jgi:hypothetical protein